MLKQSSADIDHACCDSGACAAYKPPANLDMHKCIDDETDSYHALKRTETWVADTLLAMLEKNLWADEKLMHFLLLRFGPSRSEVDDEPKWTKLIYDLGRQQAIRVWELENHKLWPTKDPDGVDRSQSC